MANKKQSKREGSFIFTFSQKNRDVELLLKEKKANDPKFVRTDYISEAVRFYEKYGLEKNNILNGVTEERVREIVAEMLKAINIPTDDKYKEDTNTIVTKLRLDDDLSSSDLEED